MLHCDRGRSGLATYVEQEITREFGRPAGPNEEVPETQSESRWFCCGRCREPLGPPRTGTIGGRRRACGFELSNAVAYVLIERHTHA